MRLLFIFLLSIPGIVFAQDMSIGSIAQNLMEPVVIVSNFISSAALILGVCCIFAAFLRYSQHRVSPLHTPISTVIWLFVLGIVLLCLPFTYLLTESGIPFVLR